MDTLRIVLPLLAALAGGGACGALITQWFQHRRARMQQIPLIERVNRLVNPELKGFFLARYVGEGLDQKLEKIEKVREYQFTLRNSSLVHLHDAEVQFEFPSEDVEGRAERTARSRTTPVETQPGVSSPWKVGFRWRIPELPPGDSLDFTFRAVDPPSDDYEVALYGGGQVVIKKTKDEPAADGSLAVRVGLNALLLLCVFGIWLLLNSYLGNRISTIGGPDKATPSTQEDKVTIVDWAGCYLDFTSSVAPVSPFGPPGQGPWSLRLEVLNMGSQKCSLQFSPGAAVALGPGDSRILLHKYSRSKPRDAQLEVLFGPLLPSNKSVVTIYEGDSP